jgi:hypothetical protein
MRRPKRTMRLQGVGYAVLAGFVLMQAIHGEPSSQSGAGKREPDTKYGLKLSVRLNRDTYTLADTPRMTVCLKNVGSSPLVLYKRMLWGASSSLFMGVDDARGKYLDQKVLHDYRDRPPFAREDFITLEPGESFEVKTPLDFEGEGLTEPGKYTVTVWYRSPVSLDFAPQGPNVFVKESGSLQSKPVAFEVTK